jgi:hypothetical protein
MEDARHTAVMRPLFLLTAIGVATATIPACTPRPGAPDSAALDAALSCDQLSMQAVERVLASAASMPQCLQDADCVPPNIDLVCFDLCGVDLAGNPAVQQTVASTARQVCGPFQSARCRLIPTGCPPDSRPYRCVQSRCVR